MLLKNKLGFTLSEALVSLLILTISIRYLVPVFITAELEQKILQEHKTALQIIHNTLIDWALINTPVPREISQFNTMFYLHFSTQDNLGQLCVTWSETSKRTGKECGEIKK
ncbi:hypothetical protein PU629_07985 [Pullulanibacillus sp. KACC 23026]|uniref:hypothetical protein n=1 Tax=Pullulanibacillus sp. KACC 23026 TaxID=3028315 RepID=UPI0023B08CB2|nr:hypothetical protein [Pullulanibacillus sp. KACC 23026]WEG14287.1 hypothetical protein PU629_07985 [Pullulanibacillus sp. KACC 23026]